MEISHSKIDDKICKTSNPVSHKYKKDADSKDGNKCGLGGSGGTEGATQLRGFRTEVLEKGAGWPGSGKGNEPSDDNARQVADDLTKKLDHDEKIKVAGLLAKTIEGGEVVEIRAVSSTSVMVKGVTSWGLLMGISLLSLLIG
ncbi:hypothetical protein ANAPC1_01424 [Anaplasma phagocytophilum]|uniref:Uncharacterized protein n=1 Tax=Anaplasma phagocytophilum TaxID=948 RepID=A0AA45UU70_ANAPH|nr:hypothetical protein ANAPC1_01424 [Anaplasma phagocytophilum]